MGWLKVLIEGRKETMKRIRNEGMRR